MTDRHGQKRATMAANLEGATGRALRDWLELAETNGPDTFGALMEWLKREHGLGHFQARLVAELRHDGIESLDF